MNWIKIENQEPELGDYSVLMCFENGSIETVHVEFFFRNITSGIKNGIQQYTKWWKHHVPKCTHWMYLPEPPKE